MNVGNLLAPSKTFWNPASVTSASKIVWYDPTQEALGALATLKNRFGSTMDAVQATGSMQPVNTANQLNGRNGLVFTKSNSSNMTVTFDSAVPAEGTIFIVCKLTGTLFDAVNPANYVFDSPSGNRHILRIAGASTKLGFLTTSEIMPSDAVSSANIIYQLTGGASATYYTNGKLQVSGNSGTNSSTTMRIGGNPAANICTDMILYEMIRYGSGLSAAEAAQVRSYLSTKWGIPA